MRFCMCLQVISPEKPGNHIFRLTGPGADQDPKGLFTIDIDTGDVSVSRSLDREAIDSYQVSFCVQLVVVFVCTFFWSPVCPPGCILSHWLFDIFSPCDHRVPIFFIVNLLFNSVKIFMRIYCPKKIYFTAHHTDLWKTIAKTKLILSEVVDFFRVQRMQVAVSAACLVLFPWGCLSYRGITSKRKMEMLVEKVVFLSLSIYLFMFSEIRCEGGCLAGCKLLIS